MKGTPSQKKYWSLRMNMTSARALLKYFPLKDTGHSLPKMAIRELNERIYLWEGIDLFTKYGLFNKENVIRKETGIGFTPPGNWIIKGGWSSSVDFTFGTGVKFSLNRT